MFKKSLFFFLFTFIYSLSFAQIEGQKRSDYLDQLIVDAKDATERNLFFESYRISNFIIDTIPNMPGIDSNYYLGMGLTMLSVPFSHQTRDQSEGLRLLNKAQELNKNINDPYLAFEIAMNKGTMFGESNELDSALSQFKLALDISSKKIINLKYYPLLYLNRHYQYIQKPDSALYYLDLIKQHLTEEHSDSTKQAEYYFNLGEYYLGFGGGSTDEMWLKAIDLVGKKDAFLRNVFFDAYAYLQKTKGNYRKALEYKSRYTSGLEVVLDELTESHISTFDKRNKELKMITKVRDLELQSKLAQEKERLQQKWIIVVSILAFVILIGFVFLYFGYKKQQQLNLDLEKAKNKALEVAELKSQFSETVSHELRTPLHGVIGLTSILISDEKENLSPKGQEYLDSLKFSGNYLLNLINDVLQISKVDAKKLTLEHSPFDFKFLITNLSSSFQYLLEKNQVDLKISVDDDIPRILIGDAVRLSQVIINLVGNAIKFTQKGEVNLRLILQKIEPESTTILFEIEDTGIGIPKDKQAEVFEKFTQITSNSSSKGGTGLGLPIVKELLFLHNSEIHLESELGKGSKFWFSINFEYSTDQELQTWDDVEVEVSSERKRVLIVDDNEINRIVSEKILEKYNYDITLCENGEEALVHLKDQNFNVILMDLHMPKKDGKDTIIEFRKADTTTPVILLTASNIEQEWEVFKEYGFNDYISKPYDRYDFLRKIMKY